MTLYACKNEIIQCILIVQKTHRDGTALNFLADIRQQRTVGALKDRTNKTTHQRSQINYKAKEACLPKYVAMTAGCWGRPRALWGFVQVLDHHGKTVCVCVTMHCFSVEMRSATVVLNIVALWAECVRRDNINIRAHLESNPDLSSDKSGVLIQFCFRNNPKNKGLDFTAMTQNTYIWSPKEPFTS